MNEMEEEALRLLQSETHRTNRAVCPVCGKPCDAHSGGEGTEGPQPGSIGLCFGCLSVLQFVQGLHGLEFVVCPQSVLDALPTEQREKIARWITLFSATR